MKGIINSNDELKKKPRIPSDRTETKSLSAITPALVRPDTPPPLSSQNIVDHPDHLKVMNPSYEPKCDMSLMPPLLVRSVTIPVGLKIGDKEHLKILIEAQNKRAKDNKPKFSFSSELEDNPDEIGIFGEIPEDRTDV